jgi:hypothetical protein
VPGLFIVRRRLPVFLKDHLKQQENSFKYCIFLDLIIILGKGKINDSGLTWNVSTLFCPGRERRI